MKKQEIYNNYLSKIKEVLEKDDFEAIDYILETIFTSGISEEEMNLMDEILNEVTLYYELKKGEYKERALELIEEFIKN